MLSRNDRFSHLEITRKMSKQYEVKIAIPEGCRLVGCRTDEDWAIVVFEDASGPNIRQIGFCREHTGEVEEQDCLADKIK